MVDVDRRQILAFRLTRHHLAQRLPAGSLTAAVAASGVQETPLRTGILALHARMADVTHRRVDRARGVADSLLTLSFGQCAARPTLVPDRRGRCLHHRRADPSERSRWQNFFGGWAAFAAPERSCRCPELVKRTRQRRRYRDPGLAATSGRRPAP